MPFGYIGQNQTKQKVKNSGVLSSFDVSHLEKQGHTGGSLELIAEQTVSGASTINFTTIKENVYDVHLMQLSLIEGATSMYTELRLSNDGGSSFETSNYERAVQYGGTDGSFGVNRTTSADRFSILGYTSTGTPINVYVYLYNLGSSSKYSFITHQATPSPTYMYFGGQVYKVAETINAIQILNSGGASFTGGTAKLYGVKQI